MPAAEWTSWEALPSFPRLNQRTLHEILDGGQAFRWHSDAPCEWTGVWDAQVVRLKLDSNCVLHWRAPVVRKGSREALLHYLDATGVADTEADRLPWRSDPVLRKCMTAFPHLRLLRQPFGETLLCFLCSATKQIVQIKQMVALLAERFGSPIVPGIHRLPTWTEVAGVSERDLRACQLGFRAAYIRQTAQFLAANPGWLEQTEALPYAAAKERLCGLPGVGEKVADCVLLFGGGKMEAFPVDVWIIRTMQLRYGLSGWRPPQIAQFGRVHFGAAAGLAQQFLFAWERAQARTSKEQKS